MASTARTKGLAPARTWILEAEPVRGDDECGDPASATVLAMQCPSLPGCGESLRQVVARADDGDGHPRGLKTEEAPARASRPGLRSSTRRRRRSRPHGARGHAGERGRRGLARAAPSRRRDRAPARWARRPRQATSRPHRSGRLGRGQQLQRAGPVRCGRVDVLYLASRGAHDEHRALALANVRIEDRAGGGANLDVEAAPDDGLRIGVEEHRDLVARRILELLHDQLSATRGRRPVNAAERLALLILADAVKLEPARPSQQEPPSVMGTSPVSENSCSTRTSRGYTSSAPGAGRVTMTRSRPNGSPSSARTSSNR